VPRLSSPKTCRSAVVTDWVDVITRSRWLRFYESELLSDHGIEHSRGKKSG